MNILDDLNPNQEPVDWQKHYSPAYPERYTSYWGLPIPLQRNINLETYPEGGTPYGLAALSSEFSRVAHTPEGARNTNLFSAGCRIGGLVGGGVLCIKTVSLELIKAGLYSGLDTEEIKNILFRTGGALSLGISDPRNEHGYIEAQYLGATFPKGLIKQKFHVKELDSWFERLDYGQPGLGVLALISQFESLGILYHENYLYFLAHIHLLVARKATGTGIAYQRLKKQFENQATEDEKFASSENAILRLVIGNFPSEFVSSPDSAMDIGHWVDRADMEPAELLAALEKFANQYLADSNEGEHNDGE
jgi:hypothetical protein